MDFTLGETLRHAAAEGDEEAVRLLNQGILEKRVL